MVGSYAFVLRRRLGFILAVTVLLAPMFFIGITSRAEQYTSEAIVEVGTAALAEQIIDQQSAYVEPERRVLQESDAITSRRVAEIAATALEPEPTDLDELLSRVEAIPRSGTNFIEVVGTGETPEAAQAVTEAFTTGYADYRREQLRSDLEELEAGLLQQREDAEAALAALPETADNERERAVLVGRIDSTVQLVEAVRLRRAIEPTGVKVLSSATEPAGPSNAIPVPLALAASVLAALLFAVATAFAIELLRDGIRGRREAEAVTGLPVLAAIERSRSGGDVASAGRRLRLGLAAARGGRLPQSVLLVTPPGESDQARDVADRLAASCADSGLHTLVIADHEAGADTPPSLTPAMSGDKSSLQGGLLVQQSRRTRVAFAPATNRGGYSGLFDLPSTQTVLTAAAGQFDMIILVPEARNGVDPRAVLHLAEASLVVCHLGRTSGRELRSLLARLEDSRGRVEGVVLTPAGRSASRRTRRAPWRTRAAADEDLPLPDSRLELSRPHRSA